MSTHQRSVTFYSVTEAAGLIGLSSMSLYRAIRAGTFPAVRIRGRLFVPAKAIDAMVDAAVTSGGVVDASDWLSAGPAS
jgi:excisionase family DNA binding protein